MDIENQTLLNTDKNLDKKLDEYSDSVKKGFIKKVYGLLSLQLLLTTGVAAIPVLNKDVANWMMEHPNLFISAIVLNVFFLIMLMCVRNLHPANIIFLFLFTLTEAYSIGLVCSLYNPVIVLQAALFTCGSVSLITFFVWKYQDVDFSILIPFASICLWILLVGSFFRLFFPSFGTFSDLLWSIFGAFTFIILLIVDTFFTLNYYTPDEYILATINLYLDIINLFLYVLQIFGNNK